MPDDPFQIVAVDEDPSMNQSVSRLFSAARSTVVTFASAEAFLDSGAAGPAGSFVFDIFLPGLPWAGADGYFNKPFPGRGLLAAVQFRNPH